MFLVWLVVYGLLYFTGSQTRAWPGKFVSQRFWLDVIEELVSVSGGCVESSLACAYHTRRHQIPPYHRHHHRLPTAILGSYLCVPSASSCIAETRDDLHVTAYLHIQVATWTQRTLISTPTCCFLTSDVALAARAGKSSQALSHGHRQPSCAIYENKRTPPSGHAWHPPGWRQPRVSCSALSPFSCFRGGRCVPGDQTRPLSRV